MKRIKSKQGFSLIEALVAMAILSAMTLLMFSIFNQSSNAVINGQRAMRTSMTGIQTLTFIAGDVRRAVSTSNTAFYGFSNSMYFCLMNGKEYGDVIGELDEYAYVFAPEKGELYRMRTEALETNVIAKWWNPYNSLATTNANPWEYPDLMTTFRDHSEQDTLLAEGVTDLYFEYAADTEIQATWVTDGYGAPMGTFVTNVLPRRVDIVMKVLPVAYWNLDHGTAAYSNALVRYEREFRTSVAIRSKER